MAKEDAFSVNTLKVVYVLSTPIPEYVEDETNVESAKALWDTLEAKYMAEDASSKNNSVSSVIDKLPPSWKDFKHTLKHQKEKLSLVQLGSHLHIEESLRAQENDKPKGKDVVGSSSVNMVEDCRATKTNDKKGTRKVHDNKHDGSNKKSKLTCWKCGKSGHFKRDCRVGKGGNYFKNTNGASGSGEGLRTITQTKDDDVAWWIDSSATTHACKNRGWFKCFNQWMMYVGIIHETTAPYTPQQNGVSERKNRILKEMVNSMLSFSGLSDRFWGEAMLTACYLLNRVPNKRNKVTLSELWYKKKPNLNYLRIWGCRAVVKLPEPKNKSLGERGSRDEVSTLYPYCFNVEDGPKTFDEAMKSQDVAFWEEAINDEMDSIMGNNTFMLVDLPPDCKPLGCKWIFKKKMKVDGTIEKFKARLVIQGFRQRLAFLNGDLDEEVYMKQPEGFIMPVSTPMDPSVKLMPNTGEAMFQLEYSNVIGCLLYAMTSIRPDIAYAVGKLSRFTSNLSNHNWQAIRMILKYLKKPMDYGLSYSGFSILEGYSDAS
ncbi:Retrovirus-related Pol polyprotein from transposon TNT 1-94 [Sesamum angolense]|uniref:Retrovirus-related Pol polyprotein from transposon TNT 1-94 n=1 Tax=Sesamum angolense TaxID=2727404 RepID=A0AAE1W0B5_9LAMI|nr:Retrovirus-related Pol polyprotein from transposon TNT 1-94 [Sesamum angolense]